MSELDLGRVSDRVNDLGRRLERIERLEPAVMKQEIRDVKEDLHEIATDLRSFRDAFQKEAQAVRSLLTRFFIAISLALVSGIIYVLVSANTR